MDSTLKTLVWNQYGAAIDMLDDAISLCPDRLWTAVVWEDEDDPAYGQFWFVAYHTLSWLDLYLTGDYEGFKPPAPFVRGQLPDQPYAKEDVQRYLVHCRRKCQSVIEGLTREQAYRMHAFPFMQDLGFLELQLYTMRHVQEHAAQLSLVLGSHGVTGTDWIAQARTDVP